MMRHALALLFFILLVTSQCQDIFAQDSQLGFTEYMLEWREKSEIAQDYLRRGEEELKKGQKYKACVNQKLASKYGVEAFNALINAQQYTDTDKEFENIEENLSRWKKLSNCNTANSLFYSID